MLLWYVMAVGLGLGVLIGFADANGWDWEILLTAAKGAFFGFLAGLFLTAIVSALWVGSAYQTTPEQTPLAQATFQNRPSDPNFFLAKTMINGEMCYLYYIENEISDMKTLSVDNTGLVNDAGDPYLEVQHVTDFANPIAKHLFWCYERGVKQDYVLHVPRGYVVSDFKPEVQ